MEAELRALRKGNVDVGFFQEAKLTDMIRARQGEGYSIWAIEAEIRHWGGMEVLWREDAGWKVERIVNFGPRMESFLMT